MSNEKIQRIEQAIRETYALLGKELSYSPEFRKQGYINELTAHLDRLQAMLPKLDA